MTVKRWRPTNSTFLRAIGGLFAGSILGFFTAVFLPDDRESESGIKLIAGPLIGALLLAVFGAVLGGVELRGRVKYIVIGTLCGIALGATVGTIVIAPAVTALTTTDPIFHEKVHAINIHVGMFYGAIVGAFFGIAAGMLWVRRSTKCG